VWYNERAVIKMEEKRESHKRKELRIKQFDYSSKGAYFVTICVQDRKRILSEIFSPVGGGDPYQRNVASRHFNVQKILS
jgi:hypothetical protein